jgi:hypothetical protein
MKAFPEVGLEMRFEAGISRSDFATVPLSLPRGRRSNLKSRLGESTGVPATNGLTLPSSGLISVSSATEKGCPLAL